MHIIVNINQSSNWKQLAVVFFLLCSNLNKQSNTTGRFACMDELHCLTNDLEWETVTQSNQSILGFLFVTKILSQKVCQHCNNLCRLRQKQQPRYEKDLYFCWYCNQCKLPYNLRSSSKHLLGQQIHLKSFLRLMYTFYLGRNIKETYAETSME